MTIEEKRRELFEAAYLKKYFYPADRWELVPEKYRTQHAEIAWWAYCAALDAVVIELPERDTSSAGGPDSEMGPSYGQIEGAGYNYALDDCRTAIESTGLGLKVLP